MDLSTSIYKITKLTAKTMLIHCSSLCSQQWTSGSSQSECCPHSCQNKYNFCSFELLPLCITQCLDVFQQSFFTCRVKVCEPLFSSCISFSSLSIDGSKPTVQEDILYPTGSPKLSSRYSQNKTQCMGIKARPQLLLHPLGSINEPSYSCIQWPNHHQQDQQWCTSKNVQTSILDQGLNKHAVNKLTEEISLHGSTTNKTRSTRKIM